jgi:hypothetical protein
MMQLIVSYQGKAFEVLDVEGPSLDAFDLTLNAPRWALLQQIGRAVNKALKELGPENMSMPKPLSPTLVRGAHRAMADSVLRRDAAAALRMTIEAGPQDDIDTAVEAIEAIARYIERRMSPNKEAEERR